MARKRGGGQINGSDRFSTRGVPPILISAPHPRDVTHILALRYAWWEHRMRDNGTEDARQMRDNGKEDARKRGGG